MKKNKHLLKLLLIQIREAEKVRREEHESFAKYCGLQIDQIKTLNVFEEPDFSLDSAEGFDAVLVGGASDASVLEPKKYTFVPRSQEFLYNCANIAKPVFASCFGFQLAVLALGGKVIHDSTNYEMGTIPILTTGDAQYDPLYSRTGKEFYAVSVHKEKAVNVPECTIELAYTNACSHSFRVKNKPFWAFQFHPEVDKASLIERLTYYKSKYTENDSHLDEVLANARETPKANDLCKRFIDNVLLAD